MEIINATRIVAPVPDSQYRLVPCKCGMVAEEDAQAPQSVTRPQTEAQPQVEVEEQAPLHQESRSSAPPAAPVVDGAVPAQDFLKATGEKYAQMVPPETPAPIPEGLRDFDNAAAIANGMEPKQLTPQERGLRYKTSKVNTAIMDMIGRVKSGVFSVKEKIQMGTVPTSTAKKITELTGVDVTGFDVALEARQVEHILKDHGEKGKSDRSMANPEDIARMEYALQYPDDIRYGGKTNAYTAMQKGKSRPVDTVLYEAQLSDNSYYVVQAVPDTKKKTLYIVTAFMGKPGYKKTGSIATPESVQADSSTPEATGGIAPRTEVPQSTNTTYPGATPEAESTVTSREATQPIDINDPGATSETAAVGTSIDIVPENAPKVNGNSVNSESTPTTDTQNQSAEGGQDVLPPQPATLGRQNIPSGDIDQSRTYTNTGLRSADEDIRSAYKDTMRKHPDAADYQVKHNKDTLATAQERTATMEQVEAECDYLLKKTDWTAEDNVTAKLVVKQLYKSGNDSAAKDLLSLQAKIADINTRAGQISESNRILGTMEAATETETAVDSFCKAIDKIEQGDTVYSEKKGKDFKAWKEDLKTQVTRIGIAIESVDEGDTKAMRSIIRKIANERRTTAWFGKSNRLTKIADRVLNKLEFDDLKIVANAQIASMADDFRRRSASEVIGTIRKQNMLKSLQTFARNIGGNSAGGFMGSLSDSTMGRLGDVLLSRFTGKRTVGNDLKHGKEYVEAAKDAAQFSSLCVELNIPIETDANASLNAAMGGENGGKYIGKTFRANGNIAMRVLYANQKYMSYALERRLGGRLQGYLSRRLREMVPQGCV